MTLLTLLLYGADPDEITIAASEAAAYAATVADAATAGVSVSDRAAVVATVEDSSG